MPTELGVSYEPERDDPLIRINNDPSQIVPVNEPQSERESAPTQPDASPISTAIPKRRAASTENWQEIYRQYQQEIEGLLPTDRDREIAKLAFERGYEREDVCELIAVSPVDWDDREVDLIVDLGRTQFIEQQERERERLATQSAELERIGRLERENLAVKPKQIDRDYGGSSL